MESKVLFASIVLFGLIYGAFGHSYVTSPISRSNQAQSESGCRGPSCLGPCDAPLSLKTRAAISTSRGQSINIQWPRNNHAGGFIRFAWAPTSQSDSASVFDNNVQQINCHEVGGCGPSDPSNPNGGDSGTATGTVSPCQTSITVPSTLTDGDWTLQWAWFGGAFSLGDYYSCIDYSVSGGVATSSFTPVFQGGDYTYPGQQKCKFFNTNRLHVCLNEPCNAPIFPASQEESGPPAYIQANLAFNPNSSSSAPLVPAAPSTTAAAANVPSTSAHAAVAAPSTTSHVAPSTTSHASPSTTAHAVSQVPSTTAAPVMPIAGSSPVACVNGAMKCMTSETFGQCVWGSWIEQSCAPTTTCSQNGAYILCG